MSASRPPSGGASVRDLLSTAAQLFRASLLKCLPLGMLAVLSAQLPNIYWIATGHRISLRAHYDADFNLLTLLGVSAELWLLSAMMLRQRAVAIGAPILAGGELKDASLHLPAVLLSSLLATVSIAVGLLLLIVPGVFLAVSFLLLLPVVLFDGAGPYAALLRCVRLMRPLWWKALTAVVLAALMLLLGVFILAALLALLAELLPIDGPAFAAIETACTVGCGALFLVFSSALLLVLHSAASSSA